MKLQPHRLVTRRAFLPNRDGAFTLTELLIAVAIFIVLVGGVIFSNLYGLSMFRITETKLNATADARRVIGTLTDEIRTCNSSWVGNVKNGTFEALLDGETQQGSALLIYPTTNTSNYVIYFLNPSDQSFRRTASTVKAPTVLAEYVTNSIVFRAQDHLGRVLTNNQNNHVIHLNLEFYQRMRPLKVADYYKLETAMTRRIRE